MSTSQNNNLPGIANTDFVFQSGYLPRQHQAAFHQAQSQRGSAMMRDYRINTIAPSLTLDPVQGIYLKEATPVALEDIVTHSRASTATFKDRHGILQTAAADTLRTDHHIFKDGMFQRAGLRVDPAATNLFLNSTSSSAFTSVPAVATIEPDVAVGINGKKNMFRIRAANASGVGRLGASTSTAQSLTANTLQCVSFDARADGVNRLRFGTGNDDVAPTAVFDVASGQVIADSGVESTGIFDLGNGLYRVWISWISGNDTSIIYRVEICTNDTTSAGGTSHVPRVDTNSIIVGNFQREEGVKKPAAYIETGASTVTRSADVMSIANGALPADADQVTLVFEGLIDRVDMAENPEHTLAFWGTNNANRLFLYLVSNGGSKNGEPAIRMVASGGNYNVYGPDIGQDGVDIPFKIAFSVNGTSAQAFLNGVAGTSLAHTAGMPDFSVADLTDFLEDFSGTLSRFRVFDVALPEAALIYATTL